MNWDTIYVTGKCGFKREVLYNLEHSHVVFMPGSVSESDNFSLFWLSDKVSLKAFKKAISAKTILKYRLQFYCSLEELNLENNKPTPEKLTPQEDNLLREMNDWQEDHHPIRYKNIA